MSLRVYKDLVDDCSVECLPETGNIKSVRPAFLTKKNPFAYDADVLQFGEGVAIPFWDGNNWRQIVNREAFEFDPAKSLDSGVALEFGNDYWIYLCLDSGEPEIVVSKNMTYPQGSSENTSRRIGHFYYGTIRKVSADGSWVPIDSAGNKFGASGTKWQDNVTVGIVPNSLWDLKHKPKTEHPGLVEVCGFWLGAFQATAEEAVSFMSNTNGLHVTGGRLATKYGALPVTGTEGMNQYTFNELARAQGLRLPKYDEWLLGAYGSPQGTAEDDNYGWTKTKNNARTYTGCGVSTATGQRDTVAGVKPYAISARNLHDCTGNVWEWTGDYTIRQDSTSWGWRNVLGANMGQAYLSNGDGLSAFICGGRWCLGASCGARAVGLNFQPWHVNALIGSRLACDAA